MDKYSKGMLTIIALMLTTISFQLSKTNVIDQSFAKGDCGERSYKPCYVRIVK